MKKLGILPSFFCILKDFLRFHIAYNDVAVGALFLKFAMISDAYYKMVY